MKADPSGPGGVDQYIAGFPVEVRAILEKVRRTIRRAASDADETISYGIPTYKLNGNLVHFAGHRKHIGFYPAPTGIAKFGKQLAAYEGGKGSVQFPLDRPIPLDLIRDIVKFRAAENLQRSAARRRRRVTPAAVRRLALSFPGVEEGLAYGTPAWRVRGKFLARLWEDGEVLVVKCGDQERDFRMQADPETFFTTDHYRGYPTVLVRLTRVTPAALAELLDTAWRREAPRRLVAEHDGRRPPR